MRDSFTARSDRVFRRELQISRLVESHIREENITGAVALIARRGDVIYHDACGVSGEGQTTSLLRRDSIVWIASLTKPVVACAVLMALDDGKLKLDDPVSRFIPELGGTRRVRIFDPAVFKAGRYAVFTDVPKHVTGSSKSEVTIRDLLAHTSGLQSIGIPNPAVPRVTRVDTVAKWTKRLASVPLDFEPGTSWAYSNEVAFDVLVRVVEVIYAEPFQRLMKRRLLDPLGMTDTGFGTQIGDCERKVRLSPALEANPRVRGTRFFSGSAGLWSTALDYWRFAQMLLNRGSFAGQQILRAETVDMFVSDQARGLFTGWAGIDGQGAAMGLGVLVVKDPVKAGISLSAGSFGWDGMRTSRFWVVPENDLVIIALTFGPNPNPVHRSIEDAVMEAFGT